MTSNQRSIKENNLKLTFFIYSKNFRKFISNKEDDP